MANWTMICWNLQCHWKTVLLWAISLGGALVLALWAGRADAWVQGGVQPFLDGEAPVVHQHFCRLSSGSQSRWCGSSSEQTWREMIQAATAEWNNTEANFIFTPYSGRAIDDPCRIRGAVAVIFASSDNVCPGDERFVQYTEGGLTVKEHGANWARIYIFHGPGLGQQIVYGLLLHELGHIVGLDHPDEYGQNVVAIMNSRILYASLQPDDIAGIRAIHGKRQVLTGYLENPSPDSFQSGIGVISGWVCEAEDVTIEITTNQGAVLQFDAAYGTERTDTAGVCGDTNNGFGLLFNWNHLGGGEHEVIAFVDGEALGHAMASVTLPSQFQTPSPTNEFIRGASGECRVEDFPKPGLSGRFQWNEGTQHLELVEVFVPPVTPPVLETLTTAFDGTWQFTYRVISSSSYCIEIAATEGSCTIVNGVVQCGDGFLQGTVAKGGTISGISIFSTFQGHMQGSRGSGTWQLVPLNIGGQVMDCTGTWAATKQ